MTEAFLNGFADRWLRAWNSHDTAEVLALLHDDVTWDDRTFWPEVIHGIAGMPAYIDKIWEAMPGVAFTETERFFNPGHTRGVVLFEQSGSAPEKLGISGSYRSHGCDIFLEFSDGLLAHYLGAYDIVRMLEQMGALPPRGSRTGSAHVMALARGPRPPSEQ